MPTDPDPDAPDPDGSDDPGDDAAIDDAVATPIAETAELPRTGPVVGLVLVLLGLVAAGTGVLAVRLVAVSSGTRSTRAR